eukprot:359014-Chlamydomonas_euryale.AAC.9
MQLLTLSCNVAGGPCMPCRRRLRANCVNDTASPVNGQRSTPPGQAEPTRTHAHPRPEGRYALGLRFFLLDGAATKPSAEVPAAALAANASAGVGRASSSLSSAGAAVATTPQPRAGTRAAAGATATGTSTGCGTGTGTGVASAAAAAADAAPRALRPPRWLPLVAPGGGAAGSASGAAAAASTPPCAARICAVSASTARSASAAAPACAGHAATTASCSASSRSASSFCLTAEPSDTRRASFSACATRCLQKLSFVGSSDNVDSDSVRYWWPAERYSSGALACDACTADTAAGDTPAPGASALASASTLAACSRKCAAPIRPAAPRLPIESTTLRERCCSCARLSSSSDWRERSAQGGGRHRRASGCAVGVSGSGGAGGRGAVEGTALECPRPRSHKHITSTRNLC